MTTTDLLNKHYLFPSTLFVEKEGYLIDTILGSCVAVCLYDTKLKIGGMNHYMLPLWNGEGLASPKYGNIANEKLIEKIIKLGSSKQNLIAKIFGGANQINSSINVGDRNIQIAKEQLSSYGIKIAKENLGGTIGRKIRFDSSTGEVLMKFLSKQ
ncbi:chemotaxis protein CheD [Sphingobacteriaceae bacterium]|nr:chemotaxis protein CheD [Sphingobacteriaceae bacterium]